MSELVNKLDGWLNPILVKELRQSVKGRSTVIIMNLALVLLLGAILVSQGNVDVLSDNAGLIIFSIISSMLSLVCCMVIPLIMYGRTAGERNPDDPDLMYISNMTPMQIVLGKYATGLSLLLFYICMALPFMAFSYMFKGIDIFTILFSVSSVLATSFTIVQMAVMLGAIPMKKGVGVRVVFLGFFLIFFMRISSYIVVGALGSHYTLGGGIFAAIIFGILGGGHYSTGGTGPGISGETILAIILFVIMFNIPIFLLNIAMLRPATTNRSLAIRLYLTCLWPVLLLVLVYYKSSGYGSWFAYFYSISQLSLIISLSGRDEIGIRLRRLVPQGLVWRNLSFLLYGGSAGGIIWSLLLIGATLVVSIVAEQSRIMMSEEALYANLTTAMMVIGYSLLIWFVSRKFFPDKSGAIVSVFAFAAMMIVSLIVTIARGMMMLEFSDVLLYISPMGSLLDFQPAMPGFAAAFMTFNLILVLPFFIRQYAAFKPIPLHKEVLEQL